MPDVRWLLYRLRNLWRRQTREADFDAELQFHIETEAEEQIPRPSAPPSACSSVRHSSPPSSRRFEASASIRPSPCAMSSALASRLLHSDSG